MLHFLLRLIINAAALAVAAYVLPGIRFGGESFSVVNVLIVAFIFGLVNAIIKPVLWFLTLPLTVLTFGLFALVVNALMLQLTAWLVADFKIRTFGSALLAALVMAVLSLLEFIIVQWLTYGYIQWSMGKPEPTGLYL